MDRARDEFHQAAQTNLANSFDASHIAANDFQTATSRTDSCTATEIGQFNEQESSTKDHLAKNFDGLQISASVYGEVSCYSFDSNERHVRYIRFYHEQSAPFSQH